MSKAKKILSLAGCGLGIVLLFGAAFLLHRNTPFMMDDIWYGTNLATGGELKNLSDVIEGQIWHFMNWGGRSVTHAILQLTIMSGELMADVINLVMTALLSLLICRVAGSGKPLVFLLAASMVFSLNANMRMSMFWQAGVVNYVYSTSWIMIFLLAYLQKLENPNGQELPGIVVWMPILGLMTGWSNENMGPACMLVALGIVIYLCKFKKTKLKLWMLEGILTAFLGSIMVILAPGNFTRASTIEKTGLMETIYLRFLSMLTATGEFLFPVIALTIATWLVYRFVCAQKLKPYQICLIAVAVLAHGAMAISPHYPDRATFGIMVVCIALSLSMWIKIKEKAAKANMVLGIMTMIFWSRSMYLLLEMYV